ncbi:LPP20 family lipoprotein [Photobacterium halotolerans]|uniref:Flagellar biosynthesis protein FlgP n=1 Tax=Photobacterium halotolerans TaxID=265726 RepID=A0A7X5ASH6_9GAMM|nr:LPP20 family lipoprotein [Photobacterium halotolerans]NAW65388.1 flagellar biosynthesis protein FlgP [Photobacterium halotolerans]NAW86422.1 flagellar biosynthesis protein FlgP [Photobacterium halotolerans]NAX46865.1 flagellar biosynthesis protein FlgP [Photobacterium halotolerans]
MRFWWMAVLLITLSGCQPLTEFRDINVLTAVGYASISEQRGQTLEEKRIRAMRASKVDAYRELTEQVYGMRISARTGLTDQQLDSEETDGAVDGVIRGAEVIRSYPVGDSYVTEMQLDLNKMERMKQQGEVYHVPANQEVMF